MRIVVVSPPRSGNHWTKCLLGYLYGLNELREKETFVVNPRTLRHADRAHRFPDGVIDHMHARFTPKLVAELEALPAHVVTAVRDPYDLFLSYYRWVQTRSPKLGNGVRTADQRLRSRMVGRPLDDPEVLAYLAEDFGDLLNRGNGWLHSGRAIPLRYEDLHADPAAALKRVSEQIQPVDQVVIEEAIAACQIDLYLKVRPDMAHTVRSGKVGESRQQLTEAHLRIFRERWADLIVSLGYPVR